jgi:tetratricopeptide (TPR) repeat protein
MTTENFPSPEPLAATSTHNFDSRDTDTNPSLGVDVLPPVIPLSPAPGAFPPLLPPPDELRTNVISREEFPDVISSTPPPLPPAGPRVAPLGAPPPPPPRSTAAPQGKASSAAKSPALEAIRKQAAALAAKDWAKLLKAEINARWFFSVAAAVLLFWVLALSPLFVYSLAVARPKAPVDAALEKETKEKRQSIAEAQKLFAAGQYERSLALCRTVLARSPNNQLARRFALMSENAMAGRQQQADKAASAEKAMLAARAAFAQGNYEEAKRGADEVLSLDGGRVEAQQLRTDATTKIAEAEAAAAAKKKAVKTAAPVARRASTPTSVAMAQRQPSAPPAVAAAPSGPTTLRLVFDSPISEGNLMVAVNDKIVLRQPFDFRKGGLFKKVNATGTVDVALPIQAGALSVKAWLSGPDIPASLLAQTSAQISAGETKVLRLDYSNGRLSARVQ